MTGMRERTRHLRGSLDIQSNAGGTTISVTFPLSTTSSAAAELTTKAQTAT
jgi:signal transduction histidine kinase